MNRIFAILSENRDIAGYLHLEDSDGRTIVGPFPVCGRSSDFAANGNGNPTRNPLLPFGDTPLGKYRVTQIMATGGGTTLSAKEYGPAGVIVLEPTEGDAALADANGRFNLFIQGGQTSAEGKLRATSGSLRMLDKDLKTLIAAIRHKSGVDCECIAARLQNNDEAALLVENDSQFLAMDPPLAGYWIRSGDVNSSYTPHSASAFANSSSLVPAGSRFTISSPKLQAVGGAGGTYTPGGDDQTPVETPPPGSHFQNLDGLPVVVPDGSHAELIGGQVTIVPDQDSPAQPAPTQDPPPTQPPASDNPNENDNEINFNFIGTLEGGQKTEGYIPDADESKSGVTVATGVDLGQMSAAEIQNLDVPDSLKAQLAPYAGLTGQDATDYLADHPLNVAASDANALDSAVQQGAVDRITNSYDAATTGVPFSQLPPEAQTVITSVAFQYGNLATSAPNFWHDVTTQDWDAAIDELQDFHDKYSTRHETEASLLQQMVDRLNQQKTQ